MKRVTPGQSAMIRRLIAAGCPISYRQLLSQEYPLRVFEQMPGMGTNVLPLSSGGTGIALRLRIVAVSATTITGFSLRKTNWANIPITWADFCEEHGGYCFHDGVDGSAQIEAGDTLNFRVLHSDCGVLKSGGYVAGYLLGTT